MKQNNTFDIKLPSKAVVQKNCSEGLIDGKLTLKGQRYTLLSFISSEMTFFFCLIQAASGHHETGHPCWTELCEKILKMKFH